MSSLGKEIKRLREERGITQKQIADVLKVTPQYISNIERGVYAVPSGRLVTIAKVLRVKRESLFDLATQDYRKFMKERAR